MFQSALPDEEWSNGTLDSWLFPVMNLREPLFICYVT